MKEKYTAVELFAGAGGLSFGLERAGFRVVLANEIEADFAATLAANHPLTRVIHRDVHGVDFTHEIQGMVEGPLTLLSGGPPCQGFSTVGSKNRMDPRNSLFFEYLRAVSQLRPRYVLFENVAGFARLYEGEAQVTLIRELAALGYETVSGILEASDFGLPQRRQRMIVMGWRKGSPPLCLPQPTHTSEANLLGAPLKRTLMEAISDLPPLGPGQTARVYASTPCNAYQEQMRERSAELTEHSAACYGERMQEILRLIPPGGSVLDLPLRLRPASYFANTYARLLPDQPSPTITRNFGTPSSSRCVHPYQNRALSTREGARLQGFPDHYVFCGSKGSKNLQIGNAVPPIFGEVLAREILRAIQREAHALPVAV